MYDRVLTELQDQAWLLRRDKLDGMAAFFTSKASGISLPASVTAETIARAEERKRPRRAMSVAVLPVFGVLANRANLFTDISGGSSLEQLGRVFDELVTDDTVGTIVLDIESPGGAAQGTMECADKIYRARSIKPVVAVANAEAASGAYWLGAAAGEFVVVPSGEVGSVGAYAVHVDRSGANETAGLAYTYVSYGEFKVEENPNAPLSKEAREHIQQRIDVIGQRFERAVARYRGVNLSVVKKQFGRGQMFLAEEAIERKMVDRIDTLEGTIARLAGNRKTSGHARTAHARRRLETGT
jgi:signal peptide peptidase SppA